MLALWAFALLAYSNSFRAVLVFDNERAILRDSRAADVAASEKAPFEDLNNIIADRYDQLGEAKVEPLFGDPHTHTSRMGAELNAECVIAALKGLKSNPLAPYFTEKAAAVAPYAATAK